MDMNKDTTTATIAGEAGTAGEKKLRRTRDDRILAGVCSGAARFLGVDANIIRAGLAVFTVFGGAGIALYAIGWVLIPEEGAEKTIAEDMIKKASDSPAVQDAVKKTRDAFNKPRTHA
ncbi:PspC domain-containing protein [Actinomadura sp. KC06]|uniref:PspC domain-containing protein n=1 Tax=Actinomadura sp. KC06 TaxID=2530369 RepID=UPI001FB76B3D|nr:PspC domain-containing protein [Actinomadura sp. KC06]